MSTVYHFNPTKAIHSVILADDDDDDQFFFRQALADLNPSIQVDTAKNGEELLQLLTNHTADLIFVDLNMPVKNGFQCLREIRANPKFQEVPVIVFSSDKRPAHIEMACHLGANIFFLKPFNYTDLKSALKSVLTCNWKNFHLVNGKCLSESKRETK
jgi:CheY-like chemotaxis protein